MREVFAVMDGLGQKTLFWVVASETKQDLRTRTTDLPKLLNFKWHVFRSLVFLLPHLQAERGHLPTLRFHEKGVKRIMVTSEAPLLTWMRARAPGTQPTFMQAWSTFRGMSADALRSYLAHHGKNQVWSATLRPGDTLYMPAGMVLAEIVTSDLSAGVKVHMIMHKQQQRLNEIAAELTRTIGARQPPTVMVVAAVMACGRRGQDDLAHAQARDIAKAKKKESEAEARNKALAAAAVQKAEPGKKGGVAAPSSMLLASSAGEREAEAKKAVAGATNKAAGATEAAKKAAGATEAAKKDGGAAEGDKKAQAVEAENKASGAAEEAKKAAGAAEAEKKPQAAEAANKAAGAAEGAKKAAGAVEGEKKAPVAEAAKHAPEATKQAQSAPGATQQALAAAEQAKTAQSQKALASESAKRAKGASGGRKRVLGPSSVQPAKRVRQAEDVRKAEAGVPMAGHALAAPLKTGIGAQAGHQIEGADRIEQTLEAAMAAEAAKKAQVEEAWKADIAAQATKKAEIEFAKQAESEAAKKAEIELAKQAESEVAKKAELSEISASAATEVQPAHAGEWDLGGGGRVSVSAAKCKWSSKAS